MSIKQMSIKQMSIKQMSIKKVLTVCRNTNYANRAKILPATSNLKKGSKALFLDQNLKGGLFAQQEQFVAAYLGDVLALAIFSIVGTVNKFPFHGNFLPLS